MKVKRNLFLQKLINRKDNKLIKVITGIRRCGKSYLLFKLYYEYLIRSGVKKENIIKISLEDDENEELRDAKKLSEFIRSKIKKSRERYYIFIDEVQMAISKEEIKSGNIRLYSVLNGLLRLGNTDVYVTGSNSKMLSKDIMTEFRGRGDNVEVFPLSFAEFFSAKKGDKLEALEEYMRYGGLPLVLSKKSDEEKTKYLSDLFQEVYFKDILERYEIRFPEVLSELTDDLCSSIGSLTNSSKIANTIKSVKRISVDSQTISSYLNYLEESFLFQRAQRYDVKGKKYFSYPSKFYCMDIGLRNARLNMRQIEETHIMENVIYNELIVRGFSVDVGIVEIYSTDSKGKKHQSSCEIDFIANKGSARYYIQSALFLDGQGKTQTELRPLLSTKDSFKKIIITKSNAKPWTDNDGILHLGLCDFLLNENLL